MLATIRTSLKPIFPVSILLFATAAAEPAQAHEAQFDLHIPPQNLSSALNELSRQSKVQIIADGSALQGKKSTGLHGKLTLRQALENLLAGAGLGFRFIADNAVAIKAENPTAEDLPHTLKKMTVTAAPSSAEEGTYNPPNAVTATKTDTPIMETPASVETVPQQVLKDQQIIRIGKALENVSGVTNRPSGVDGDFDLFNLRGFYYGDRIYRDGVPIKVGSFWNGQRDVANIDRIEVLKGPGAVLYGRTEPGGLVNIVTKQPQPEPYHALLQQIGNWDLFRTTLDSTGPVPGTGQLSYRFNFDFEKAGSFRQFVSHDRKFFAPVVRWDLTAQTRMNFELEYRESANTVDPGLPLVNGWNSYQHPGRIPQVPITRNYGEPSDRQHIQETLVGLNWTHDFNEDWSLFHRFNAVFSDTGLFKTQPLVASTAKLINPVVFAGLQPSNRDVVVPRQHIDIGSAVCYNTINLTGHFDTFGLAHTLLFGADFNQTSYTVGAASYGDYAYLVSHLSNLYQPAHNNGLGPVTATTSYMTRESWYGTYLQDQMTLPFGVHALAGLRYDNASEHYSGRATTYPEAATTPNSSRVQDSAVIPRFGLLWQPVENISIYGNYTENFGLANVAFPGLGNQPLHAETAKQWETGIKTQWLDGKLGASMAAFKITKNDVATLDPACLSLSLTCYSPFGAVQSRGLEFDLKGEILPQWQIIGTYTYLETEVLNDVGSGGGAGDTGRPLIWANNPRNMGSLWTTYEWTHGILAGLTLGGGALVRGTLQSAVGEPGYALVNLMAAYSLPLGASRLTAQINMDNLLNKSYWLGTDWTGWNEYPGTPRTVLGSLRLEF